MIDKLSSVNPVNFTGIHENNGKKAPEQDKKEMPQHESVISKNGAKAIRNTALALAILGGTAVMPSCDDDVDVQVTTKSENYVKILRHLLQPDTVYVSVPGENDTITIILPGDTVTIKESYSSAVADSLIAHAENLGFEFDGEGTIPVRITAFDQFNSTMHDLVFDGTKSSEEQMVFIDEAKDYSKDSENPEIRYNRVDFSVLDATGTGAQISTAPEVGVKPASAMEWIEAAKLCFTNLKNGTSLISELDDYNNITEIGTLEKSTQSDVDFFENLFVDDNETDTYFWTEAKMVLASPEK